MATKFDNSYGILGVVIHNKEEESKLVSWLKANGYAYESPEYDEIYCGNCGNPENEHHAGGECPEE